jgi:hypothetical protein
MKSLKSAFNPQGSRLNYIGFTSRSSNGGAKKEERQGEIQFATKTEVPTPLTTLEC